MVVVLVLAAWQARVQRVRVCTHGTNSRREPRKQKTRDEKDKPRCERANADQIRVSGRSGDWAILHCPEFSRSPPIETLNLCTELRNVRSPVGVSFDVG